MPEKKMNYSKKIFEFLDIMPEFVGDFILNFSNPDKTATKLEYCRDIEIFLNYMVNNMPQFCDKTIKELTLSDLDQVEPLDINRFMTCFDNGHKETTVKRKRAAISSMYSFFVNSDKLKKNPVAASRPIKIPEKNVIYLTNEEQRLLLETVRSGANLSGKKANLHYIYANRDSAMFLLLLDTGLRVSEMLDTKIRDFDLDECSVVVTRKGGDIQTVFYSDECRDYLKTYIDSRLVNTAGDDSLPTFVTSTGKLLGVRAVEMLVKKYIKACMPDKVEIITPHKLRSSFAMSFYEASDNNILLLQKKLNHKSISTTNIYAKASDTALKESRSLLQGRR